MLLNCDLGELDNNVESFVMPYIDMANIACGEHAGDDALMAKTLQLAKQHNVMVGAHPSYPDRKNFGRVSMTMSSQELQDITRKQISRLIDAAALFELKVSYVKPHGALYNDMMKDISIYELLLTVIADFSNDLSLMIQATPFIERYQKLAKHYGVTLILEAFADRRYTDNGNLLARSESGAVLSSEQTISQVKLLQHYQQVIAQHGKKISVAAESICVHGDNIDGVKLIKEISKICKR
ncbi:5-oxoprolinase subunit PxpA [Thalassotalea ganghwensis]